MLRVSVLGPIRAWVGDVEVDLGQTRQRVLFALLAANPGRFVGRAELIAGLWDPPAPPSAAGSIHTYVSGLRRALAPYGHELVTSKSSAYALHLDPADLDSERFGALVARAADVRVAGDFSTAAGLLDEALRLWAGDEAYAGLNGFDVERAHLRELRLAAVEARARALMELGDRDLIAELAVLVHENPLHEPLHELLMLALHRAGRHADALEVFRTARRTLAVELGVEPGPALRELQRTVLAGVPSAPAPPARLAGTPPRSGRTVPEAHQDAQRRLREMARDLLDGKGGVVLVEGAPASGKTTLVTAAFADAGCQVAWTLSGDVAGALGHGPGTSEELASYVHAICRNGPLLLVADGLEDQSLWRRLAAASRRAPLLVVATSRRAGLATAGTVLRLPAPAPGAVERLVARLDDLASETRDVLVKLAAVGREFGTDEALKATGMTPFDLVGVVETVLAAGILTDLGGRLAFTHTVQYDSLRPPPSPFPSDLPSAPASVVPGSAAAEALLPDSPARSLVRRVTELSALDRLDEAERLLSEATLRAIREGTPIVLSLASAVPSYWRGHWDDIPQQAHGVAALIAAHRGDSALAEEMLAVNGDDTDPFAGAARALLAEQHGEFLAPPRDPQWLPDAVRCALAHGRTEFARSSAAYCDERAAAESSPARAHVAALRCRALLTGDPDPALQAAAHDEASGRPVERAAALEDAAVLLAAQRGPHEAASAAAEARAVYTRLDARWDLRRAEDRLAEYGITTA